MQCFYSVHCAVSQLFSWACTAECNSMHHAPYGLRVICSRQDRWIQRGPTWHSGHVPAYPLHLHLPGCTRDARAPAYSLACSKNELVHKANITSANLAPHLHEQTCDPVKTHGASSCMHTVVSVHIWLQKSDEKKKKNFTKEWKGEATVWKNASAHTQETSWQAAMCIYNGCTRVSIHVPRA